MGGVVVGIVRADRVAALKAAVEAEYHGPRRSSNDGAEDPRRETFFVCVPISGVGALELPLEDHAPEERPA
jgi:galactokinase